jgi:hypothetical protein
MADAGLLQRAARCYRQAGAKRDAARCFGEAGLNVEAGDLFMTMGHYREAAREYAAGGRVLDAAWLLVDVVGDPRAAREQMARTQWGIAGSDEPDLLQRLVMARCEVAEGGERRQILKVLGEAQASLAQPDYWSDPRVEHWAVAVAEAARRYDQAALVFAAAVRGRDPGAVRRWQEWSARTLGVDLQLPTPSSP